MCARCLASTYRGQDRNHVFTHEGDAGVRRHIQRRGGGPGIHPNEQVPMPRGERLPQCRPAHRGQSAHTKRMVQLPGVYPRSVRPTERSPELKIRMLRAEVLQTMLHGCVAWSPRACHYNTLRRIHHSFLTRGIGWRKKNQTYHPVSFLDTLIKTGSESIEATLRRRRIVLAGFVARIKDTRLPKCVIFGELVGGADCVEGQGKKWMGYSLEPQSFRHQRRSVDGCRPGRGRMAQDGGTRGETFHGGIDRCRESQGWTTACSGMPERDGKNQGEEISQSKSGFVLVRD